MAASSRILKITPTAERDLAEIWTYIAADDPRAATRFVQQVEAKFEPLCEFPGTGAPRDHLAAGLRAVPYKSYVIYYVHTDTDVTIVRVVHGARDLNAMQFDAPSGNPEPDRQKSILQSCFLYFLQDTLLGCFVATSLCSNLS